jgi:hypothetical protein
MGYSTEFKGSLTVTPPLGPEAAARFNDFASTRHADSHGHLEPGMPGAWCQWIASPDGSEIRWDGNEKFYEAAAWMRYVLAHLVAATGSEASGIISAQGEEAPDRWRIVVKANEVKVQHGRVVYE